MKMAHEDKYHVTLNDVIQTVFIILKLCKLIDWSWWLVLTPFWVALSVAIITHVVVAVKFNKQRSKEKQE